jgi:Stealth protein CR2, conserved region 2/Stealth protein CR3, conserved region 3/Stealth protein CR1, conserved region 1
MRSLLRKVKSAVTHIAFPHLRYRMPGVSRRTAEGAVHYVLERPVLDVVDVYRHNLALVIGLLEAKGIEYFVESGSWGTTPIVGLTRGSAEALMAALVDEGLRSPVYVGALVGGAFNTRLARSIEPSQVSPAVGDAFRVFYYLRNSSTDRKFGAEYACLVHVWQEDGDGALRNTAPRPGGTTYLPPRRRRDLVRADTYGVEVNSHRGHDEPGIFEVDFPVDVVSLWVDGSDPEWQERRASRLVEAPDTGSHEPVLEYRYRQFDELRYSLRALERFAPWVRNIYLVTDRQRPEWLSEAGSNLRIVDHTEILPESALPTFNSHALTASLHKIPNLSEQFLVFNDDIFLGRPVTPNRFFQSNGVTRFYMSRSLINSNPRSAHEQARLHSCDLILAKTGARPTHVLRHAPHAFNRELLAEAEEELAKEWKATVHNPFRSADDIVPEYIHHYLGYARRLTTPSTIDYRYFGFGTPIGMEALGTYQHSKPSEVLCINDLGGPEESHDQNQATLLRFLDTEFPYRSRYERTPD